MKNAYTLYELNNLVRDSLEAEMPDEYWVQAEISDFSERGGHCYLELVEKDERSNTPIAKARATIWKNVWMMMKPAFRRIAGQPLSRGMKVLICVTPTFHAAYGFSWNIHEIDPTYTIGDLERRKQEIVARLKEEGVFDLNKQLQLPIFCQNIAVISSSTAAGYGDFCNQLLNNPYNYKFKITLFESTMQGENVESSIINALNRIYSSSINDINSSFNYDCVVIIRGGGASSDLSGFDTYNLAANIAQFPLPVITGIGHDRDETILDMVSHTRVKTPTAAAEFLIAQLAEVDSFLEYATKVINNAGIQTMKLAEQKLSLLENRVGEVLRFYFERQRHLLEIKEQKLESLDPKLLLKRGYSITLVNGKVLKNVAQVKTGDKLTTMLSNGKVSSKVEDTNI